MKNRSHTRTPLGLARALGLAAAILAGAPPAAALIVHEGRVVREWPDQPQRRARTAPGTLQSPSRPIGTYPDPKGAIWGLTILIDFSDTAPAFTKAEVEAWLNQRGYREGGLNGSIRDYFFDNSNGVVDFQNQVVGFYRASQPKSYYEADTGYSRATALVNEAVAAIDAEVDFSMFDNDGDGRTEAVSVVYAGPSVTFARGLWPHAGSINTTRDGVQVRRYQMTNMGTRLGLYVFAHEIGHMMFGWPDLYGFGNYCIMGNSSSTTNPVGINDFYRADQGWIPVIDIASSTNARYYAVPNTGGYRYVNPGRPDEAFFWSNVQATNRWSTLAGSGIVLLHFDYAIRNNDPPNPLSLAVVQADGMRELDAEQWPMPGSDASDFYHSGTKTEFSATTNPSSAWNNGSASGLRIYEISANGPMMTFAVGTGTPGSGIGGGAPLGGRGGAGGMTSGGRGGAGGMTSGGIGGAGAPAGGASGTSTGGGNAAGAGGAAAGSENAGAGGMMVAGAGQGASGGMPSLGGTTSGGASGGTSTGGGVAGASLGGSTSAPPSGAQEDDGGCSCHLAPKSSAASFGTFLLALAAGVLRRRRVARRAEGAS
ncbi:MAG TPA: M6 family metalloprotease domain-containing protein [Polyangiaceae bacterium]